LRSFLLIVLFTFIGCNEIAHEIEKKKIQISEEEKETSDQNHNDLETEVDKQVEPIKKQNFVQVPIENQSRFLNQSSESDHYFWSKENGLPINNNLVKLPDFSYAGAGKGRVVGFFQET
jgi:D-ribose pyranose/furanose isomerase RbsD